MLQPVTFSHYKQKPIAVSNSRMYTSRERGGGREGGREREGGGRERGRERGGRERGRERERERENYSDED